MSAPRYLEKFTSLDGTTFSYAFSLLQYEYESSQGLRSPVAQLAGAHYAFRLRGSQVALKDVGRERVRCVFVGTPAETDADIAAARSNLYLGALGKVWLLDALGTRYWAYAELTEMPEITISYQSPSVTSMVFGFRRLSDWYTTTQRLYQIDLGGGAYQSFTIRNNGPQAAYAVEFRLRSLANFVLQSLLTSAQTDAARYNSGANPVQGDGLAPFQSAVGSWRSTTNLVTNGGFETNQTGHTAVGTVLHARVTVPANPAKFGGASLAVVVNNLATNEGTYTTFVASGSVVHTISAWVRGSAATWNMRIRLADNAGATILAGPATAVTTDWQRLKLTSAAALTNGVTYRLYIETSAQQAAGFYADGFQAEALPFATPYVETNGGTASRNATHITTPSAGALNATAGWFAIRLRMPLTDEELDAAGGNHHVFDWRQDGNNLIQLVYDGDAKVWKLTISRSGVAESVSSAAQNFAADADFTLICYWTAGQLGLSINGAAFTTAARAQPVPTITAANVDIGNFAGVGQINALIRNLAFGTGTPTNADAAAVHARGDTDWSNDEWPASMVVTRPWSADGVGSGTSYYTNPFFTNNSNGAATVSSLRDSVAVNDELKFDSGEMTIERSTNDGGTYADDSALASSSSGQFLTLVQGANVFIYSDGGATPNALLEARFYEPASV